MCSSVLLEKTVHAKIGQEGLGNERDHNADATTQTQALTANKRHTMSAHAAQSTRGHLLNPAGSQRSVLAWGFWMRGPVFSDWMQKNVLREAVNSLSSIT